jgi:alpha/beta hydrolase fold
VHFLDFGGPAGAPVLVCVHGLGGSHVNWLAIGPPLAQDHRVLALDLPGHGLSAPGRPPRHRAGQPAAAGPLPPPGGRRPRDPGRQLDGRHDQPAAGHRHPRHRGRRRPGRPGAAAPRARPARPAGGPPVPAVRHPLVGERYLAWERRGAAEELVRRVLVLCCVDPARVPAEVVEASVELARQRKGQQGLDRAFLEAARSLLWLLGRRAQARAMLAAVTPASGRRTPRRAPPARGPAPPGSGRRRAGGVPRPAPPAPPAAAPRRSHGLAGSP